MPTLEAVAQMTMDQYYQTYKSDDQFFELEHFMFMVASVFSKTINDDYNSARSIGKIEDGTGYVEISPDWLIKEVHDVKESNGKKCITLNYGIMPFDFDAMGNGVQQVLPIGHECCTFQKITGAQLRFLCQMPTTKNTYYNVVGGNELFFYGNPGKKVEVYYVPEPTVDTPNLQIHNEMVFDIIAQALKLMFASKNGNAMDMSNNQNANVTNGSELAPGATNQ